MHSSLILHGMGQNERIASATTTTAIVIILLDLQRCFDCNGLSPRFPVESFRFVKFKKSYHSG